MKRIVILGGGTGGTMIAHRLAHARRDDWDITLIEKEHEHIYQPGLLFVPFGLVSLERLRRPSASLLPPSVIRIALAIDRIDPVARRVTLSDGTAVPYDVLIVAAAEKELSNDFELGRTYGTTFNYFNPAQMPGGFALAFQDDFYLIFVKDNP